MMWRPARMLLMLVMRMMVMWVMMMMMPAVERRFANVHHHTADARSCGCDTATGCTTTSTATPLTVAERIVEQRVLVLRWWRHGLKMLLLLLLLRRRLMLLLTTADRWDLRADSGGRSVHGGRRTRLL